MAPILGVKLRRRPGSCSPMVRQGCRQLPNRSMLLGCLADMHPDTWRRADSFPRGDVGQRHSDAPHSAVSASSEAVFQCRRDVLVVEQLPWMPSESRVTVDSIAAQVGRPHADVLGQRVCGSADELKRIRSREDIKRWRFARGVTRLRERESPIHQPNSLEVFARGAFDFEHVLQNSEL